MAQREPMDAATAEIIARLRRQIDYRERELTELHTDYLSLEQRCNALMGVIRRQAARDRFEIAQRQAKAAND